MKLKSRIFIIIAVFAFFYFMPFSSSKILNALMESLLMAQDYARQHVLLCLIPAFFIAGAIANFISQENIIKYFGAEANKFLSYTVASVSGTILAVCSCTVLPLFAGIYKRGAGIGPATAFLYSGPAINLLGGVLVAGFLLGRPGSEALIPKIWIENLVGGNSIWSNLFASVVGALMYFATLTEIPILQGLLGAGMGKGPALALLLAGPALSLPNMLVIRSIIGTKKTLVFVSLVVIMAAFSGMVFGYFF